MYAINITDASVVDFVRWNFSSVSIYKCCFLFKKKNATRTVVMSQRLKAHVKGNNNNNYTIVYERFYRFKNGAFSLDLKAAFDVPNRLKCRENSKSNQRKSSTDHSWTNKVIPRNTFQRIVSQNLEIKRVAQRKYEHVRLTRWRSKIQSRNCPA